MRSTTAIIPPHEENLMKTRILAGCIGLVLCLTYISALAVPGWSRSAEHLLIPPSDCRTYVPMLISKKLNSSNMSLDGQPVQLISPTTYLIPMFDYKTGTGIFAYCVSNPIPICSSPSTNFIVVTFSDSGQDAAVWWRDFIRGAVGYPHGGLGCDIGTNPIDE